MVAAHGKVSSAKFFQHNKFANAMTRYAPSAANWKNCAHAADIFYSLKGPSP
jgi:hypothetical protein